MNEFIIPLTFCMILIAYIIKIIFIVTAKTTSSFIPRLIFIVASTTIDAICMHDFFIVKFDLLWRYDLVYLICDIGFSVIIYQIFHVFNLNVK